MHNVKKVALSGGLFQNKYILERTENLLERNNFLVLSHKKAPTNDGGISLGQLAIASKLSSRIVPLITGSMQYVRKMCFSQSSQRHEEG